MQIPECSDFKEKIPDNLLVSTREQAVSLSKHLLASFIILLNVLMIASLYTFRTFDDNRLTSWQWLMDGPLVFTLCLTTMGLLFFSWKISLGRFYINTPTSLFFIAVMAGMGFWSIPEVIVDSARYFSQAKYFSEYGLVQFVQQWGNELAVWTDLPLIPFIYGLMFELFGESRIVIQFLVLLMFAGSVVLTYNIGKSLWDEATGYLAGALLLGMPFLLSQVGLMMVDVPSMFFLTLAVWSSLQVIKQQERHWIFIAGVSLALAMLSKYSVWMMLTVIPILLVTCHHFNWQADAKRLLWVFYIAGILLAPFVVMKIDLIIEQLLLLKSFQLPGLLRWQESTFSSFLFQIHPFISIAALVSVYHAIRQRDWHYIPVVWMWILILSLGINRSRYMIIALPMMALMAAYAIRWVKDHDVRNFIMVSIVMTSLVLSYGAYRPFLQSTSSSNLQQAGRYLDQLNVNAVEIIVLPQQVSIINPEISIPILDLFTRKALLLPEIVFEDPATVDKSAISKSSVRFSWEFKLPDYYQRNDIPDNRAITVVRSHPQQALPAVIHERLADYNVSAQFTQAEGVFRYRTDVVIYERCEPVPVLSHFSREE